MSGISLRWVHISDVHFPREPGSDSGFMVEALHQAVREISEERQIDLIFVTGDLAFSGQSEEYEHVQAFFEALTNSSKIPLSHIFVVPGNHDVDRNRVQWLRRSLDDQEQIDEYCQPNSGLPHLTAGMTSFLEWYDGCFAARDSFATDTTCQTTHIAVRNTEIDVLLINTAVFCRGDDDHEKLIVGRTCLDRAVKAFRPESCIRIAIAHHPIDWLHEVDRPFVRSVLRQSVHFFLHGHTHDPDVAATFSVDGSLITVGAGATYQTENFLNSFWVADVSEHEVLLSPYKYSARPRPKWTLDTTIGRKDDDFAVRIPLEATMGELTAETQNSALPAEPADRPFEPDNLLFSPLGEQLYVEPRLGTVPLNDPTVPDLHERQIALEDVVVSSDSVIIESRREYGATTLAYRLEHELKTAGKAVTLLNARGLPAYGKKFSAAIATDSSDTTLILDDFDISDHRRILRYIKDSGNFSRYILVTIPSSTFKRSSDAQVSEIEDFKAIFHWPLARRDVRTLTQKIFGETTEEIENAIVDKVYVDLLSLKIPLSPGNVIMYLRVLLKEENFAPATRVDIVFRYVAELLRRSSDIYRDSFGSKSKIDVISAFSYNLFKNEESTFTEDDWRNFCSKYSVDTLFDFDAKELLSECERVKIFAKYGSVFYYRYSSYFPLFVGKYISAKPDRVREFVEAGEYNRVDRLVEVVSALSSDNSQLIESLSAQLNGLLVEFRDKFVPADFEPYKEVEWGKQDEEKLWSSVDKGLLEGPKSAEEIDRTKTSIVGEIRTDDQSVRYTQLLNLESELFRVNSNLSVALRNSESIAGSLKVEAAKLVHDVQLIALQIGFLLAPTIAKSYFVNWGGIAFVNPDAKEEDCEKELNRVISVLPLAVLNQSGEDIGTRRLSAVFHRLVDEIEPTSFTFLANFACVVAAKGQGWENAAKRALIRVDKNTFYLRIMLGVLIRDFQVEVNSTSDRESLKTLISVVHSKRQGTNAPGNKLISKVRQIVDKKLQEKFDQGSTE